MSVIIAGKARNLSLKVPSGTEVRPTSARSRKALFDSIADFAGLKVLDLFAGSGALGLEAASRGAGEVVFVEKNAIHCAVIEENIRRVRKTECVFDSRIINADAAVAVTQLSKLGFELIFADPPYPESAALFCRLIQDNCFLELLKTARLIWELPDKPHARERFFTTAVHLKKQVKRFGSTDFLILTM